MGATKSIRHAMLERDVIAGDIAPTIGITQNNLLVKLKRDNFRFDDVVAIADALGCDVVIVDDDTGEPAYEDMPAAIAIEGLRYNDLEAFARYLGCSVRLRTRDAGRLF